MCKVGIPTSGVQRVKTNNIELLEIKLEDQLHQCNCVQVAVFDASKVTVSGPGLDKSAVIMKKKTYFEVNTAGRSIFNAELHFFCCEFKFFYCHTKT